MALLQWVSRRVLEAESREPGTVLDHDFLSEHTLGLDEFRAHLALLDEDEVRARRPASRSAEMDELADRYLAADRVIVTWAMGITQHRKGVDTIKEIVNLLLLRGNIGKPGAGASPIRGHSNVQGDRTMGIWERPPDWFLDALRRRVLVRAAARARARLRAVDRGDAARRAQGLVRAGRQPRRGDLRHRRRRGRDARDRADRAGVDEAQPVARRDRRRGAHPADARPHRRRPAGVGTAVPVGRGLASARCTRRTARSRRSRTPCSPRSRSSRAWPARSSATTARSTGPASSATTTPSASRISHVVPGFADFNRLVRRKDGFVLPNGPRDSRTFATSTGKAMITVNELVPVECPPGPPDPADACARTTSSTRPCTA